MEMEKIQSEVKNYFEHGKFEIWPKFVVIARLEEEISEIARILSVMDGYRENSKIRDTDLEEEFGDALFQLAHLANMCSIDLGKAMKKVFEKYKHYNNIENA